MLSTEDSISEKILKKASSHMTDHEDVSLWVNRNWTDIWLYLLKIAAVEQSTQAAYDTEWLYYEDIFERIDDIFINTKTDMLSILHKYTL